MSTTILITAGLQRAGMMFLIQLIHTMVRDPFQDMTTAWSHGHHTTATVIIMHTLIITMQAQTMETGMVNTENCMDPTMTGKITMRTGATTKTSTTQTGTTETGMVTTGTEMTGQNCMEITTSGMRSTQKTHMSRRPGQALQNLSRKKLQRQRSRRSLQ